MSMHLTQCPKCTSTDLEILKELNPGTLDMNMDVIAKCKECQHEFRTRKASHTYWKQYNGGWII